ncbi:MAG: dipicolinate synthase subunit DpsA, partial [Clostridia bacterium]
MLIIGGDMRSACLARLAAREGWQVQAVGFDQLPQAEEVRWTSLSEAVPASRVVLAFPLSEKDGFVPAPFAQAPLPLAEVTRLLLPGCQIWVGRIGPLLRAHAETWGITFIDPNQSEAFAVANAVPSAEGAIFAAMCASQKCIHGSACLIIGFGRIGQALAQKLHALGATVMVAARKAHARAWAEAMGCQTCTITALQQVIGRMDTVFNTVPAPVIDSEVLQATRKEVRMIDLASPPYGIDLEVAQALGRNAWREPGIPGRYAPETAAAILLEALKQGKDCLQVKALITI